MIEHDPNRTVQATHWKCEGCGFRLYKSKLDLEKQACGCVRGSGRWSVVNGELLLPKVGAR
jgi:hypothetical protein